MDETTRSVETGSGDATTLPPTPLLYWVYAPVLGIVSEPPFRLSVGQTAVGRQLGPKPGIALAKDGGVSRQHAILQVAAQTHALTIKDVSSLNSTWVNGVRAQRNVPIALSHGDIVRIGDSVLVVSTSADPPVDIQVEGLVGRSGAIAKLRYDLSKVAQSKLTVLLLGEPGTGKERAARGLLTLSGRQKFQALDCGAVPPNLIESELFGHVKGAFSYAIARRRGVMEEADGGLLFLDEVGNMSLEVQRKFLRALQERRACPVGGQRNQEYTFDIFLTSATNHDLDLHVEQGIFMADLYSRIAGIRLRMPPLRERREDLLLLLRDVIVPGGTTADLPPLTASQVELLLLHSWPANVRDLLFVGEHLRTLGFDENLRCRLQSTPIKVLSVTPKVGQPPASFEPKSITRSMRPSPSQLEVLLHKHQGKLLPIHKEIGWDRKMIRKWVREFGLEHLRAKEE